MWKNILLLMVRAMAISVFLEIYDTV